MANLSTLQITTLDAFRNSHPGPVGIILEDDQGYFSLIRHLTGEAVCDWNQLADLKRRMVAWCINGNGGAFPGFPDDTDLRQQLRSYCWCFVLYQATVGRPEIAAQMDGLLDEGQQLGGLILVNYHLDHFEAKDNMRRLFAMIPTIQLYFPDAQHLFEIDAANTLNPGGARQVAKLFEQLRKAGLPLLAVSYREYRRSAEALGSRDSPKEVVSTVRQRLRDATDMSFELKAKGLPPKDEFWDRVERAIKEYRNQE